LDTIKKVRYKEWDCLLNRSAYENGGRIALFLIDAEDGEPVSTCTVNLPAEPLGIGEVFIKDYSENEGMAEFLVKEGVVELTGRVVVSGYVKIPVGRLLV
jgi:hypothetical protein